MREESNYFAFISYKSEDSEWAIWLQHELMHYHLPASYNGRKNVRKNLRPIFRDIDELCAGNLPEQIHRALKNSQNLIVICSPRSAESKWVNDEVETFISLGRTDRIFPFIVDGSKPADFFPPALLALPKEKERLGGDVRISGKDAAFVKIVAGMLGLRFSSLWNKYELEKAEEQRKVREQRDNLLKFQSRFLAEKAGSANANGNSFLARHLALNALPEPEDIDGRPYVAEAEKALRESFLEDSFIISVPLQSSGYSKVISTRNRKEIILLSPEELYVVDSSNGKIILHLTRPSHRYFDYDEDLMRDNAYFRTGTISPDGQLLATAHEDNACRIWNLKTGDCIGVIQAVFGFDEYDKVYTDYVPGDDDNSILPDNMHFGPQYINCIRFSHDGKTLAVSSFNCTLWDTGSLKKINSLYGPRPFLGEIDISSDGKYISTPWGYWDINTGLFTCYSLSEPEGEGFHCQFSQDGKSVGIILSPYVYEIDFESLSVIHKAKIPMYSLESSTLSPDLRQCFFKDGMQINSINLETQKMRLIEEKEIQCFCFEEQTNGLVIYTADNMLVFRSADSPVEELELSLLDNEHLHIVAVRYPLIAYGYNDNVDNKFLSNPEQKTRIVIYDASLGKVRCFLGGLTRPTNDVVFSYDYHSLAAVDDELLVWKIPGPDDYDEPRMERPLKRIAPGFSSTTAIAPLTNGRGIVYAADRVLAICDGKSDVMIESPSENDSTLYSPWHKATNGEVYWKDDSWDDEEPYYAMALAVSPDENHLIAAYNDSHIRIWDLHTRSLIKRIFLNSVGITSLDYSIDGKYVLAMSSKGGTTVFNAQDDYKLVLVHTGDPLPPLFGSLDLTNERIVYLYPSGEEQGRLRAGALPFPPIEQLNKRAREQFKDVEFSEEEKKQFLLD